MRLMAAIIFFLPLIYSCMSLECGIGHIRHDRLGETIELCLRRNKTLARMWDKSPISTSSSESESSSSESDDADTATEYRNRRANVDGDMKTSQSRKGRAEKADGQSTTEASSEIVDRGSAENGSSNETSTTSSTSCIVQCIFQNMNMTDSNGFPDHQKIIDGLVSTATRQEMKDFLRDTGTECFDEIEKETNLDSCTYSANLINCLADKGKENCSDWPVGNLPF